MDHPLFSLLCNSRIDGDFASLSPVSNGHQLEPSQNENTNNAINSSFGFNEPGEAMPLTPAEAAKNAAEKRAEIFQASTANANDINNDLGSAKILETTVIPTKSDEINIFEAEHNDHMNGHYESNVFPENENCSFRHSQTEKPRISSYESQSDLSDNIKFSDYRNKPKINRKKFKTHWSRSKRNKSPSITSSGTRCSSYGCHSERRKKSATRQKKTIFENIEMSLMLTVMRARIKTMHGSANNWVVGSILNDFENLLKEPLKKTEINKLWFLLEKQANSTFSFEDFIIKVILDNAGKNVFSQYVDQGHLQWFLQSLRATCFHDYSESMFFSDAIYANETQLATMMRKKNHSVPQILKLVGGLFFSVIMKLAGDEIKKRLKTESDSKDDNAGNHLDENNPEIEINKEFEEELKKNAFSNPLPKMPFSFF